MFGKRKFALAKTEQMFYNDNIRFAHGCQERIIKLKYEYMFFSSD